MDEQKAGSIHDLDPDTVLLKICKGQAGKMLSHWQRLALVLGWNNLANAFEQYGERLTEQQREVISPFFLRPLRKRYRMHRSRPSIILRDSSREKVKSEMDLVHSQFHKLRFMARIRCNQARRLHEAVCAAVAAVKAAGVSAPVSLQQ